MSMLRICVNLSIHTLGKKKKKTLNQFSHLPPFKATLLSFWQNLINFSTYTPSIAKVPHFFLSSLENELVSFYLKTKKQKQKRKQTNQFLSLSGKVIEICRLQRAWLPYPQAIATEGVGHEHGSPTTVHAFEFLKL